MAQNLKVEISKSVGTFNPDLPTPWNVTAQWGKTVTVEVPGIGTEEGFEPVRTWSFDAPSELVAKTIQTAFNNMTDAAFEELMNAGYER